MPREATNDIFLKGLTEVDLRFDSRMMILFLDQRKKSLEQI